MPWDAVSGTWLTSHFLPEKDFLCRIQGSHPLSMGQEEHDLHAVFHALTVTGTASTFPWLVHWNLQNSSWQVMEQYAKSVHCAWLQRPDELVYRLSS